MSLERHFENLSTTNADIELFVVPWDTQAFGVPVAQLERVVLKEEGNYSEIISALQSWFSRNGIRFASCRLPSDRLRESMLLEEAGFRFVEMVYRPSLTPLPAFETTGETLVVGKAAPDDLPAIESIAERAFSTGRFALDWRLDSLVSGRRYRQWVRDRFDDPTHRLLKATLSGDLVGFFLVEPREGGRMYWHLTALAPAWQSRGLGGRLWKAMVEQHRSEGRERIDTTISAHNVSVMNIYAKLGFKFRDPQMTFHWVRE